MAARLNGKAAIVTGAGQGVGRGIALALADDGASVMITGRTQSKLEKVAGEITERGGRAAFRLAESGVRADADLVARATAEEFGSVDILVANAQTTQQVSLEDTTEAIIDAAWRSGALGTLYAMQACLPYLKKQGGSIVTLGSSRAVIGSPTFGSYAMAKEAIRGLTKVAASEFGPYNIRVNVICPAALSPAAETFRDLAPERFAEGIQATPLGRIGDCEADIGRAVAALVSDDLSYLTGATLMLDGGRTFIN
jgi:2-hydroxycyclohexanecarboxyl-CoA dehydrogenase